MSYKIISFYSEPDKSANSSHYYTQCSKIFNATCAKYKVKPHVEKLEGKLDYFKNTRMKPRFILDQMLKFKESVMWVDIDSKIISRAPVIPDDVDIGAVKHKRPNTYPVYAHCLYFKYTEEVVAFLHRWADTCDAATDDSPKVGDHSIFVAAINSQTALSISYIKDTFATTGIAPHRAVPSKRR